MDLAFGDRKKKNLVRMHTVVEWEKTNELKIFFSTFYSIFAVLLKFFSIKIEKKFYTENYRRN